MIEIPLVIPDFIWDDHMLFIAMAIMGVGLMGLGSRSMAVSGFASFLMFAYLAMATEIDFLINILYVVLLLIIIGYAMKLWRFEGAGSGS